MTIRPNGKFLQVLRLRLCLFALLPSFICGVLSTFFLVAAVISAAVVGGLFLFAWVWYLPRYFGSYRVILSDRAIAVCRGVFFRRKYILPSPRTIYCDVVRPPILSLFGLRSVNIHLVRRTLFVGGLSGEDAELMLSYVSGGAKDE